MSLSPMLQDEAEDQKKNMQIRSHSVGAKSILGPRSLNVETAAGKVSRAVKSPYLLQILIFQHAIALTDCAPVATTVTAMKYHKG